MGLHKYNKNYALFKLHFKQHKEKYIRIGTFAFSIVIFIISIIFLGYAKFSTTNKYNVMQTSVGTFVEGDYILAAYLDGVKQTGIPTKSSSISVDHIDCDNNAVGTWSYTDWGIYITGATQRTKCTVYFVSQAYTGDTSGDSRLGNATADKVLTGSTFSSSVGTNVSGTMANNGALNWTPTSSTTYSVPAGYYSGGTLDSSGAYNAGYTAGQGAVTLQRVLLKKSANRGTVNVSTYPNCSSFTTNNFMWANLGTVNGSTFSEPSANSYNSTTCVYTYTLSQHWVYWDNPYVSAAAEGDLYLVYVG
jgi:hypothetical protein